MSRSLTPHLLRSLQLTANSLQLTACSSNPYALVVNKIKLINTHHESKKCWCFKLEYLKIIS